MAKARKGQWRLTVLLCGLSGLACASLMAALMLLYGTPYNTMWWWVMGGILAAACLLPRVLVWPIEWVIEGYRECPGD